MCKIKYIYWAYFNRYLKYLNQNSLIDLSLIFLRGVKKQMMKKRKNIL